MVVRWLVNGSLILALQQFFKNPIITFSERRSRTSQDSSMALWQWLVDIPLMIIWGFPDDFYQPLMTTGMIFKDLFSMAPWRLFVWFSNGCLMDFQWCTEDSSRGLQRDQWFFNSFSIGLLSQYIDSSSLRITTWRFFTWFNELFNDSFRSATDDTLMMDFNNWQTVL